MIFDPLNDSKSKLQLIDSMGSDLSVVNDAKASFQRADEELTDRGKKLIGFLVKNGHTSPLRGCVLKIKVNAPLFVARQWYKYSIASSHTEAQYQWNEASFRYIEITEPEFYVPETFRQQSTSNKQKGDIPLEGQDSMIAHNLYLDSLKEAYSAYRALLALGVCREQARAVLPPAVYTSWVWTASLQSVMHFVSQRLASGAQWEIRQYALVISKILEEQFPVTWEAWYNYVLPTYEK